MADKPPVVEIANRHLAWIAAWGVVVALAGTVGGIYWDAYRSPKSGLPLWPVFGFGLVAFIGLYMVFSPLAHVWPFGPHPRTVRRRNRLQDAADTEKRDGF